jgi:hypothetical protein
MRKMRKELLELPTLKIAVTARKFQYGLGKPDRVKVDGPARAAGERSRTSDTTKSPMRLGTTAT